MRLHEELYFEITAEGKRSELSQFEAYLKSGILDDYFEVDEDFIIYDDEYWSVGDGENTSFVFSNDEYGIEISSFDPEGFLDIFCKASASIYLTGHLFDSDDAEYRFISPAGTTSYENADDIDEFNDELDAQRTKEESFDTDDDI